MRQVRRAYSRDLRTKSPEFAISVARELLQEGRHRWVAYELIGAHPQAFHGLGEELLEELGDGIDSW